MVDTQPVPALIALASRDINPLSQVISPAPQPPAFEERDPLAQAARALQPLDPTWLTSPPPRRDYLLRLRELDAQGEPLDDLPFFPAGKVGLLASPGGVGKTTALFQLAIAVATGLPWLGCIEVETPGRVLVVVAEEDHDTCRRKVYNAFKTVCTDPAVRDDALAELSRNLHVLPASGHLTTLYEDMRSLDGRRTLSVPTFFGEALVERLNDDVTDAQPWRLVLLDPISRFAGWQNENDNADATRLIQALEVLAHTHDRPAVLAAHHSGKYANPEDAQSLRGASALVDGVRWAATIRRWTPEGVRASDPELPDRRVLDVVKSNYTRPVSIWLTAHTDPTSHEPWFTRENDGERAERERYAEGLQSARIEHKAQERARTAQATSRAKEHLDGF